MTTGIPLISDIRPKNDAPFGVVEDKYFIGGFRRVDTLEERDEITEGRRRVGMLVSVVEDGKVYRLEGGIENANWVEFGAGGAGVVMSVSGTSPIQSTGGVAPVISLQASATDVLFGRSSAGAGNAEEIPLTGAGRAILDDVDNTAQRVTLGLGDAATLNVGTGAGTVAAGDHTHSFASLTSKPTTLAGYGISDAIPASEKNAANGVAGLDGSGKVPQSLLPAIALIDAFPVASEAAMLALVAETGDVAVRTDISKSFILQGSDPSVLGDWLELLSPTGFVQNVTASGGLFSSGGANPDISIAPLGVLTGHLANDSVTDVKLRDSAGLSVVGREGNSPGDPADIIAVTDGHVLRLAGTTLGFGQIVAAGIANNAVGNAQIRQSAARSVVGVAGSLTANVADIAAGSGSGGVLRESGGTLAFAKIVEANITALTITHASVATANKDGLAATPSMRTLGGGALQACAGNDSRLFDARTPTGAAGEGLHGTYPNPWIRPNPLMVQVFS
jgi:hypothetical protein